jgi:murein endopeptidase
MTRRSIVAVAVPAALLVGGAAAGVWAGGSEGGSAPPAATVPPPATGTVPAPAPRPFPRIHWRRSRAVGLPYAGRLARGVRLPPEGRDFFTWDPVLKRSPDRWWRRYGHDRLIRTLLRVLRAYRAENPGAPRVGIGDISRPRGGDFGPRFGSIGHASHQNGLDVDVCYPRRDGRELQADRVRRIDRRLAQDLVDRFVAARARYIFVGPHTRLRGPRRVVQVLAHHDDHLHVRLRPRRGGR